MKGSLIQEVVRFLKARSVKGSELLLLGCSGGGDSLALLHLLIESRRRVPFHLQVVHVDHGWRPESRAQAEELRQHVESLGVLFHLVAIEAPPKEAAAREARLQAFGTVYRRLGARALLLAHHRDDQAETVLKRLFEGAHLTVLKGMAPVARLDGMEVWRPLLSTPQRDLRRWGERRGVIPLDDPTNRDPKYLRARMRAELLPLLAKSFGKEISGTLSRLGDTLRDLTDYLDGQLVPYFAALDEGGKAVDLSRIPERRPFEVQLFLKRWTDREEVPLSAAALATLYSLLAKGSGHVATPRGAVVVDGSRIAINRRTL